VTDFAAGEVDGVGGTLVSYDGREVPFDLLVTVPLHGCAAYVGYDTEPVPGRFPTALGPLPLLRESRLNHLGKLMFHASSSTRSSGTRRSRRGSRARTASTS